MLGPDSLRVDGDCGVTTNAELNKEIQLLGRVRHTSWRNAKQMARAGFQQAPDGMTSPFLSFTSPRQISCS